MLVWPLVEQGDFTRGVGRIGSQGGKSYWGSERVLLVCRVGAFLGSWVLAWPLMEQGASIGGVEDNLKYRYRGRIELTRTLG